MRFAGRVVGVFQGLVEVPDRGLFPVGVPLVFCGVLEGVQHRLVHLLVIAATQDQRVLHPDTGGGVMEPGIHAGTEEVHLLGVRVEAVESSAIGEAFIQALERGEQESCRTCSIALTVVLDLQPAGGFEGYVIRRVGQGRGWLCVHPSGA